MNKSQLLFFRLTVIVWLALLAIIGYHQWIQFSAGGHLGVNTKSEPQVTKPEPKPIPAAVKEAKKKQLEQEADYSYSSRIEKSSQKKPAVKVDPTIVQSRASPGVKVNSIEDFHTSMTWKQFSTSAAEKYGSNTQLPRDISKSLRTCSRDLVEKLNQRMSDEDLKWCQWSLSPSGGKVQVGKSYGTLNARQRDRYEQLNCNAVAKGENPSCDDAWGDNAVISWKKNEMSEQCGDPKKFSSRIKCRESRNMAKACVFENALIDFEKLTNVKRPGRTDSRKWASGFIATHCDNEAHQNIDYYHFIRPFSQENMANTLECDYVINKTVVIYGHDDTKNVGHTMSDFMNVWAMLWLAGLGAHGKDIVFLNTDAIREGHNYYDELGQLRAHYDHQFAGVLKAHDFYQQNRPKVCVKRLLVQPQPVILFTWDGWWQDMRCSFVGPSSLFQRWNLQIRNIYGLLPSQANERLVSSGGLSPATEGELDAQFRVLLVHRVVAGGQASPMYTSRVIANIDEVTRALQEKLSSREVPGKLIVQDLAKLSFEEQVHLLASVDMVIGVHGAGIPNSMHMSIGQRQHCCSVLEIFPQGEFFPIRGYGNMARRMGLHYHRMELPGAASGSHGAKLPIDQLNQQVGALIDAATQAPSCVLPSVLSDPYFDSIAVKY